MQVKYDADRDALFIDFRDNMKELEKEKLSSGTTIVNSEADGIVRGIIIWPAKMFLPIGFLDKFERVVSGE